MKELWRGSSTVGEVRASCFKAALLKRVGMEVGSVGEAEMAAVFALSCLAWRRTGRRSLEAGGDEACR